VKTVEFKNLCGVPYGALALASLISAFAEAPMLMCRKENKEHGTKKRIDGKYSSGDTSLIIEDVVTTGSSIIDTAEVLRAHGLVVKNAIVVLDREQGAKEKLAERGIRLTSILKLNSILAHLPQDLDATLRSSVEKYLANGSSATQAPKPTLNESWKLDKRVNAIRHPTARRLLHIMLKKKSNVCVAADLTVAASILQLARAVGSRICAIKLHADIIEDFTVDFTVELRKLATELDFLIIEDRKFADTGNVVALQTGGIHRLASWVDAFTVHGVSGPGVLEGLKTVCTDRNIACFLVAQMSSKGNLLDENYEKGVIQLASTFPNVVGGFICQKRVVEDPGFLYLSPGVHLEKSADSLGQQWRSPADAVCRDKVDIVIVGRGMINDQNQGAAAEKYREASWHALSNRS